MICIPYTGTWWKRAGSGCYPLIALVTSSYPVGFRGMCLTEAGPKRTEGQNLEIAGLEK